MNGMNILLTYAKERPLNFDAKCPGNFIFPGGEIQSRIAEFPTEGLIRVGIEARLRCSDDVMALLMTTDALRRRIGNTQIHLIMPYVPYARQDRVCNPGEALGIKVFCDLINAQHYARVTITDPHSDVTGALLNNVTIIEQSAPVSEVLKHPAFANGVTLVSPDAGAAKKVLKLAKNFNIRDVVFADKVRDTLTGEIVSTKIHGEIPDFKPLLVVDDICDGGRTFVELAKALALLSPMTTRYLYVTHGIFSKGTRGLLDHYEAIFTTDDWTDEKDSRVHIVTGK